MISFESVNVISHITRTKNASIKMFFSLSNHLTLKQTITIIIIITFSKLSLRPRLFLSLLSSEFIDMHDMSDYG